MENPQTSFEEDAVVVESPPDLEPPPPPPQLPGLSPAPQAVATPVHERVALIAAAFAATDPGAAREPPCSDGVGVRVIFGTRGDQASFSHLSGEQQLWPFVAAADRQLLRQARSSR